MNFDEYQIKAMRTARDPKKKHEVFHLILGLVGETGELAEKFKKIVRDHDSDFSKLDKDQIIKELGDVLWYTAVLAQYLDISFDEVANKNIAKLADRQKRDKISGSGDNR